MLRRSVLFVLLSLLAHVGAAQDVRWEPVNGRLYGASVSTMAAHPSGTLFLQTSAVNGYPARLFRSTDGGYSWHALEPTDVVRFVIDADGALVVSTARETLRSTDAGTTWDAFAHHLPLFGGMTAAADGLYGIVFTELFRSDNGGRSWVPVSEFEHLYLAEQLVESRGTLLGSFLQAGVYRSDDGGLTWTLSGFEGETPTLHTAPDGSVLARQGERLWRTRDAGQTWVQLDLESLDLDGPLSALGVRPNGEIWLASGSSVYRSTDDGASWDAQPTLVEAEIGGAASMYGARVFAFPPGRSVLLSTSTSVYRLADGDDRWHPSDVGLTALTVDALTTMPDGSIWASAARHGLVRSTNGGASWLPVEGEDVPVQATYIVSGPDGEIVAGRSGGDVYRSRDGGATWTLLPSWGFEKVRFGPDDALYAVSWNGAYRFDEARHEWISLAEPLSAVRDLAFLPSGDLLAATGSGADDDGDGVFRSSDGGATWRPMPMTPFNKSIRALAVLPGDVVLAGPIGSGFYRSTDGGGSFELSSLALDPYVCCFNDFLVSPGGDVFAESAYGVFYSTDRGASWIDLTGDLAGLELLSMTIDGDGFVYVGTNGAGVYRSDRPLASSSGLDAPVHEPRMVQSIYPNPVGSRATLAIRLVETGRLRVAIYDALGRQVDDVIDGTRPAGLHEIVWRPGALPDGVYFARIEAGGRPEVRTLVLRR